ncbi:MAG: DUF1016 N-terminal domain-containing protein [Velocimicrobium sp.]
MIKPFSVLTNRCSFSCCFDIIFEKSKGAAMKTINTVIANIERLRKYSKQKEDNIIYEYWKIGKELSGVTLNIFGSDFINKIVVGLKEKGIKDKAYNRRGLYRMIQFYEAYPEFSIYGEYLKEINWSCHILILDNFKGEDRDFWIELCALKKYSVRKLRKLINQYKERVNRISVNIYLIYLKKQSWIGKQLFGNSNNCFGWVLAINKTSKLSKFFLQQFRGFNKTLYQQKAIRKVLDSFSYHYRYHLVVYQLLYLFRFYRN